jgi:hypothetical protein
MRWSCWGNDSVPRDLPMLAKVLGLEVAEVRQGLTDVVLSFFEPDDADEQRLVCPELATQMEKLTARHEERSDSGRRGGKAAQRKQKLSEAVLQAVLQAVPQAEVERSSKLPEKSRTEKSRTELGKGADTSTHPSLHEDEFVRDLVRAERATQKRSAMATSI